MIKIKVKVHKMNTEALYCPCNNNEYAM